MSGNNQARIYDEIKVTLTHDYEWIWNDSNTGGHSIVSMWRAKPQDGMLPLGITGYPGFGDINGKVATLLVGPGPNPDKENPPCKHPLRFEPRWNDKGTNGYHDGACWRPIAPPDYIACGEQWTNGYDPPRTDTMYCLRNDLVTRATYDGRSFWSDQGKGAKADISLWWVKPEAMDSAGSEKLPIIAGVFRASSDYAAPSLTLAHVPLLKVPKDFKPISAEPPTFTKDNIPNVDQTFNSVKQADVSLPFTFFVPWDNQRFSNFITDPFVSLSKTTSWLVIFSRINNSGDPQPQKQTKILGVTSTQSQEFNVSVGVTVSASAGIDSTYVGENLNFQFSATDSKSLSQYEEHSQEDTFNVSPYTATVVYAQDSTFAGVGDNKSQPFGKLSYKQNRLYYYRSVSLK